MVEPLGFSLADPDVQRDALDYWDAVDLWVRSNWHALRSRNLATAVGIVLYEALRQLAGGSTRLEWQTDQFAGWVDARWLTRRV